MNDWMTINDGKPVTGVYKTASNWTELAPHWRRFQHFDGAQWGAVGMTASEAIQFADKPTGFPPIYWQEQKEFKSEERDKVQKHAGRKGVKPRRSISGVSIRSKEGVRRHNAAL